MISGDGFTGVLTIMRTDYYRRMFLQPAYNSRQVDINIFSCIELTSSLKSYLIDSSSPCLQFNHWNEDEELFRWLKIPGSAVGVVLT